MPSDSTLFADLKRGMDSIAIAAKYQLSPDSVRGRLSRAAHNLQTIADAARIQALTLPESNVDVDRQNMVVHEGKRILAAHDQYLREEPDTRHYAVFVSDLHLPYTRWDAYELLLAVLSALGARTAYVSAYNDLFDMTGYGRWGDQRHPRARLWSESIDNAVRLADTVYEGIKTTSPNATLVGIYGNHDLWFPQYHRNPDHIGTGEKVIADFMLEMDRMGVLHPAPFTRQNWFKVSDNLVWTHGVTAAQSAMTVAQKNVEQAPIELSEQRHKFDVVSGHTHRPHNIAINGGRSVNSGCLCAFDLDYLKHTPKWGLGFVVTEFNHAGYLHHTSVTMYEDAGKLKANWNGMEFAVKLDKRRPE